ncbi:SAR2788 family putative toxin [Halalkalibacter alkalisediminis]|uniref:SAR2788 family putative toxin n=1 Tax=Halalkalibacter alkalisediminis TaxID=935616 RepID=A0ABV6NEB7_9BACI|nr:SAR2788 family putative toxin [Halalkalibacter alkalisediminis]
MRFLNLFLEDAEDLEIEVVDLKEESMLIETNFEAEDLEANLENDIDLETEEILLASEIVENEEGTINEYSVDVIESEGDTFIAIFRDLNTGEEYEVNTAGGQDSAIPVVMYYLGAATLRVAVQYIAKGYLKIGSGN